MYHAYVTLSMRTCKISFEGLQCGEFSLAVSCLLEVHFSLSYIKIRIEASTFVLIGKKYKQGNINYNSY